MESPPEHPAHQQRLVLLAIVAVLFGLVFGSLDDFDQGLSLKNIVALFAFACAVTFIGLIGLAYVLHQHERWREHRSRQDR